MCLVQSNTFAASLNVQVDSMSQALRRRDSVGKAEIDERANAIRSFASKLDKHLLYKRTHAPPKYVHSPREPSREEDGTWMHSPQVHETRDASPRIPETRAYKANKALCDIENTDGLSHEDYPAEVSSHGAESGFEAYHSQSDPSAEGHVKLTQTTDEPSPTVEHQLDTQTNAFSPKETEDTSVRITEAIDTQTASESLHSDEELPPSYQEDPAGEEDTDAGASPQNTSSVKETAHESECEHTDPSDGESDTPPSASRSDQHSTTHHVAVEEYSEHSASASAFENLDKAHAQSVPENDHHLHKTADNSDNLKPPCGDTLKPPGVSPRMTEPAVMPRITEGEKKTNGERDDRQPQPVKVLPPLEELVPSAQNIDTQNLRDRESAFSDKGTDVVQPPPGLGHRKTSRAQARGNLPPRVRAPASRHRDNSDTGHKDSVAKEDSEVVAQVPVRAGIVVVVRYDHILCKYYK